MTALSVGFPHMKEKFLWKKDSTKLLNCFLFESKDPPKPAISATPEKSSHRQRSCSEGKIRVGP